MRTQRRHDKCILMIGIVIALIGISLRIMTLGFAPFLDEGGFAREMPLPFSRIDIPHTPLGLIAIKLGYLMFGHDIVAMRLSVLLFALASVVFTFMIARRLYSARIAWLSTSIMLLSFWHIVASTQLDIDGAFLTCMYTLTLYVLLLWEDKDQEIKFRRYADSRNYHLKRSAYNPYSIILSLLLALCVFTKSSGLFIFVLIFVYLMLRERSMIKPIKGLFSIYLISGIIFIMLMSVVFLLNPDLVLGIFRWGSENAKMHISFIPLVYAALWGTPFLIIPYLLKFFDRDENDLLLLLWVLIPILLYFFLGRPGSSPFDRYLMVTIPALSIIASRIYSTIRFTKRNASFALVLFLLFYCLFFLLNIGMDYLPHDLSAYVGYFLSFRWNFFFPITGSSGPVFGIDFLSVAIANILCFICFLAAIFIRRYGKGSDRVYEKGSYRAVYSKDYSTMLLCVLAIGFALNAFLVEEHVFSLTQADIHKIMHDEEAYFSSIDYRSEFHPPVFVNQGGFVDFNLDLQAWASPYYFTYATSGPALDDMASILRREGGTMIYIDFPHISRQSELWHLIDSCDRIRTFSDKGKEMVFISHCLPDVR